MTSTAPVAGLETGVTGKFGLEQVAEALSPSKTAPQTLKPVVYPGVDRISAGFPEPVFPRAGSPRASGPGPVSEGRRPELVSQSWNPGRGPGAESKVLTIECAARSM